MQNLEIVPQCAGCDQAISARAHREAGAPGASINGGCFLENFSAQRRFDDRECRKRFASNSKRRFVPKSLENFLEDGKAGDDVIRIDERWEIDAWGLPEGLDPHAGINEDHGAASCPVALPGAILPRHRFR